jgi:glycosyltransferase involved in cell wall biosynthesis
MTSSARISVCIPVYNGEKTIARTIESILTSRQHLAEPVEIVVVDDNSKDNTREILDRFRTFDHVRVERNAENLGLVGNWQRALSLGSGEIVTLLHMDDWYDSQCLKIVSDAFAQDSSLAMLGAGQAFHYEDGRIMPFPAHCIETYTGNEYAPFQMQLCECPAPSTAFFRRATLETVSPYYPQDYLWCPELDLYIRLALANPSAVFRHCREVLIHRTTDPAQFSSRYPGLRAIDICTMFVRHGDNLSSSATSLASKRAARRAIANGIAAVLLKRDASQLRMIIGHLSFRKWASQDPLGLLYILGAIPMRGIRRVATKIFP